MSVTRSATGRAWARRLPQSDERTALALAQRFGIDEVAARVLAARGVTLDNAQEEIAPTIRALLPDPSTLKDCDALVERLAEAIAQGEAVTLFGDYDVDGATSVALVHRVLAAYGLAARIVIPDRITDGYGPSPERMEALAADGTRLLVCLDCGAGAIEAVAAAKAAGLDVLVIDHHPVDRLAPADAIVNPNRPDEVSGLGDLAAVGVAFVVMVGLVRTMRRRGITAEIDLMSLLDAVALGTVADMVPLSALNRAFVRGGLVAFRRRENRGLGALVTASRIGGPVAAHHLGYVLGPRINAGGRIGDSALGARLLTTADEAEAEAIATRLDALNTERRAIEARALEEALAGADGSADVILVSGAWHPGVVGLVASRLKERYRRPAVAVAVDNALGTGSARSIKGVDLGAAVRAAAADGLLVKGGGHAMAAGLTVETARLEELRAFLCERLGPAVRDALHSDRLSVDAVVGLGALNETLARALDDLGPWGSGRPKPLFALDGVIVETVQAVGNAGSLRVSLRSLDGARASAMAFRADGPLGDALNNARGEAMHIAVELSHGTFRGVPCADIIIVDAVSTSAAMRRAA